VPERAAAPSSVGEAVDAATERLARAGIAAPRREAQALWAAVAGGGMKRGEVWLARDLAAGSDMVRHFREALERRAAGMPFAYAVGRIGFRTLELELDQRALIPRPETEGLVDLVLHWAHERQPTPPARGREGVVADIGTGCGCVALALAVEGPFERVIAVERSGPAAALARSNVARVAPPVAVEVREGDLLAPLLAGRCRAIVANPPYLSEAEYHAVDASVRRFEPREALVSGRDGLDATRALLAGGRALLEPDGLLALEIDERRAARVRELAHALAWSRARVYEDLFGRPRYLLAQP
jgi:release factor glutamine methyltransferase